MEFGVPVLAFPGAIFERRYNAQQVQKLGVGYLGELSDFNAVWIADKINKIDSIKNKATDIQSVFGFYDGANTAYNKILSWIRHE